MTLSVAIVSLNEEANLGRTLESVKWADEIVVVDSGSTDRTCEIARELGARVVSRPFTNFAEQKNFAPGRGARPWGVLPRARVRLSAARSQSLPAPHKGEPHTPPPPTTP